MKSAVTARAGASVPAAVLLSLLLASQVVAGTWSPSTPLTSTGIAFAEGIGTVGGSTALALYIEHDPDMPDLGYSYRVKIRRSTNSGMSWAAPVILTNDGLNADIVMSGSTVDVVWDRSGTDRIRYTRSFDGGLTFEPSAAVSPINKSARNPSVARGPDGVVVIAWENLNTGVLKVRVSTDGGDSFAPEVNLANVAYDMGVEVAVGDGVIYVAYVEDNGFDNLRIRRSTDDGASWSMPIPITDDLYAVFEQFDITAVGSHAYIAYAIENAAPTQDVKFRRTTNNGMNWTDQANLAPSKWRTWEPAISLQDGVVRAVFTRRTPNGVSVYYRQSSDGINWSPSEFVAANAAEASIGFAGKSIALFRSGNTDAFSSTRAP